MKALSIRQPWAWLILHAGKDTENRTWRTQYRGPILIHAAKTLDEEGYNYLWHRCCRQIPPVNEYDFGGFVGMARIVDCVTEYGGYWFEGPYGFVLADVKPLPKFIPYPGRLGLFNIPDKLRQHVKL